MTISNGIYASLRDIVNYTLQNSFTHPVHLPAHSQTQTTQTNEYALLEAQGPV